MANALNEIRKALGADSLARFNREPQRSAAARNGVGKDNFDREMET